MHRMFTLVLLLVLLLNAVNGSLPSFEIVDSVSGRKMVVARKNFLPGEMVVVDKEPLLTLDWPLNQQPDNAQMAVQSFLVYHKQLSPWQKMKLMTLFGPTTGIYADGLRSIADEYRKLNPRTGKRYKLTTVETEMFVRVANIVKINCIGYAEGGCGVYDLTSHFAHSCSPNCKQDMNGRACFIRAILPIRAGEELTVSRMSYDGYMAPTHMRRQLCLLSKELTCHCPRCDAPGDDTRQFDCFNASCKGVMVVCHPINNPNNDELSLSGMSYSGVEYVEPHLLPCSVCKLTSPVSYAADMLEMERRFAELTAYFTSELDTLIKAQGDVAQYTHLLGEIDNYSFPRRHLGVIRIAYSKVMCLGVLFARGSADYNTTHRAVCDLLQWYDTMLPFPEDFANKYTLRVLSVCNAVSQLFAPLFTPSQMKKLWQKSLRLRLILQGREKRDVGVDDQLLSVLEKLPTPVPSLEVCAFCAESPLRAALTLSHCDKCGQVAYCGAGCQKAHWKLHKKTCKNSNKKA